MTASSLTVGTEPSRYSGYAYAYPHKSAYRPFDPRPRWRDLWADEPDDARFLYLHVPFCEMRCGFCNLFTRSRPPEELVGRYVDALERQAKVVTAEIGPARYASGAVGGGTPTLLSAPLLDRTLQIVASMTGGAPLPVAVETSPDTATADRLAVLAEHGVSRISIGVQSFHRAETVALARPQRSEVVAAALDAIRVRTDASLNIDLIYGIDGQTRASFETSIRTALSWVPEEIYLYPLYVRPLTGLGRSRRSWDDERADLYEHGRGVLLAEGYEQRSMRGFVRADVARSTPVVTAYSCQDDGMVGLGCGARSYTRDVHYSFDYAVRADVVGSIIDDYVNASDAAFATAPVGFVLGADEQRRRWVIKSVLRADGLDRDAYRRRFGSEPLTDVPALDSLVDRGWLVDDGTTIRPTAEGLGHSDVIGVILTSERVRRASESAEVR